MLGGLGGRDTFACQVQLFMVELVFEKGGKVISKARLEHRKGEL